MGELTFGPDGALYGTAWTGGFSSCAGGCGVVYKLAPRFLAKEGGKEPSCMHFRADPMTDPFRSEASSLGRTARFIEPLFRADKILKARCSS
jgi:uncharacterized repeat protein (TIGR03803 family)